MRPILYYTPSFNKHYTDELFLCLTECSSRHGMNVSIKLNLTN